MKSHHSNARHLSPLPPRISPCRQQRQQSSQLPLQKPQKQQQEQKKRIEYRKSGITPTGTALREGPQGLLPSSISSCVLQSPREEYNAAPRPLSLNTILPTAASSSQVNSFHATRGTPSCSSENVVRDAAELEEAATSVSVFGYCLTDEVLREHTGWEDLHLVLSAEFRIDATSMTGVDTIGERMPMLESLKLNNSRVPQIRLLGTRFANLKWLWLGKSRLENLRGIGACTPVLKELYVPFNFIHDISPLLDLCETLEVIDLEGNAIEDALLLNGVLPLLSHVKYLTLQGNPVVIAPSTATIVCERLNEGKEKGKDSKTIHHLSPRSRFRAFLQFLMPNLEYVDDVPIYSCSSKKNGISDSTQVAERSPGQRKPSTERRGSIYTDPLDSTLSDEYMFLQECIRDCGFDALELAVSDNTQGAFTRPSTSCAGARRRLETSSASGSQRPHSSNACGSMKGSSRLSPPGLDSRSPAIGPATPPVSGMSVSSSFSSALTTGGGVLVGSAIGLRRRLPPLPPSATAKKPSDLAPLPEKLSATLQSEPAMDRSSSLFDDEDDNEWEELNRTLSSRSDKHSKTMEVWTKYAGINESGDLPSDECESSGKVSSRTPSVTRTLLVNKSQIPSPVLSSKDHPVEAGCTNRPSLTSKEEESWRRELVRYVAQTRSKTARVAHIPDFFALGSKGTLDDAQFETIHVDSKD